MSNKNNSIKNLIDSHSWLGLIISILLFLVFWAGSVSLFKSEIQNWALLPHHPIDLTAEDKPLIFIIEETLKKYPLNTKEHLTISLPTRQTPYYQMAIDLLPEDGYEGPEQVAQINVNPKTGEIFDQDQRFILSNFIYKLHYNLSLSTFGNYLIGFVTLFFLFAIISGIFIHAKKIFANFFTYRKGKSRTKLLDLHNVVGVTSLPFTIMYAITGLIFNLIIIYQIAFAIFLYEGDQEALLNDAGYAIFDVKPQTGQSQDMSPGIDMLADIEKDNGGSPGYIRFHNYGDEHAVMEVGGEDFRHFSQDYKLFIQVSDGDILKQEINGDYNALTRGVDVVTSLHFGDFAGIDLRFLYFILGLAVAAMIAIGNMLWIEKRAKQKNISTKGTIFVGHLTVGSCSGIVVATALAFLIERALPEALTNRATLLVNSYTLCFLLVTLGAFFTKAHKQYICIMLYLTASLLLTTISISWLLYSEALLSLWQNGIIAVMGVDFALLVFSGLCIWTGKRMSHISSTESLEYQAMPETVA